MDKIVGGSVPREFIAPIDAGYPGGAWQTGGQAGYPVVDIKATLVDGSYHEVDSSEMAFKIAGSLALKDGSPRGKLGHSRADHEGRSHDAGRVHGRRHRRPELRAVARSRAWKRARGAQVVRAIVPLANMFGYATDLRSTTQGRAVYSMEFDHYAPVPSNVAEEMLAKARRD